MAAKRLGSCMEARLVQLTLSVLRCPPAVAPETRTLAGGEYSIGRGPGVDWILSDVNQMVSRRHCTLEFQGGEWRIIDESANGTFANRDEGAIGKGNSRVLRDHDRLRIGPYEIEVLLQEEDKRRPLESGEKWLEVKPSRPLSDPFWENDPVSPFTGRTQDDHGSALGDGFHPPNPVDLPPSKRRIPVEDLLPEGWEHDLLSSAGITPPALPAGETPGHPLASNPPTAGAPAGVTPLPTDQGLLAAFLSGAGVPSASVSDPAATMHQLGETFRALVAGLRAAMIARASIKSEFRIEQTLIQSRNNNPLKFSTNDEDALAALLNLGRRTGVLPAAAVADALRDMRVHELASMAAMQVAVRALVARLDPGKSRAAAEQGGGRSLMPNHRKVRAWELHEALYAEVSRALDDDFDNVFGKAFARAYEEALHDLTAEEKRGRGGV